MSDSGKHSSTASAPDDDGVRIIREPAPRDRRTMTLKRLALLLAVVGIGIGYFLYVAPSTPSRSSAPVRARGTAITTVPEAVAARIERVDEEKAMAPRRASPVPPMMPLSNAADPPSGDDNDIATYLSPDDPEPTMSEVIQALRDSGDHGGIAAFNPPGTSPPLQGLAVPEDFVLPPGYVRHHQVTDDGQPIEAILMFSPDHVFRDADGRPIPIPEDRVVPPQMAPPGLEIRPITIPPPPLQ